MTVEKKIKCNAPQKFLYKAKLSITETQLKLS